MIEESQAKAYAAQSELTIGPDEQIYRAYRRHWAELIKYAGIAVLFALPPVLIVAFLSAGGIDPNSLLAVILWLSFGFYFAFGLGFLYMEWLFWYFDVWIITNERLIDVELVNLFRRQVAELHISQVQDVRSEQSGILSTLFNYGNVICQTAGTQNYFTLRGIPLPEEAAGLILDLHEVYIEGNRGTTPDLTQYRKVRRLNDILVSQGYISAEQMKKIEDQYAHLPPSRLGEVIVQSGLITSRQLIEALGLQNNLPVISLADYELDPAVVNRLPQDVVKELNIIPVSQTPNSLTIAVSEPAVLRKSEYLTQRAGMPVAFVLADPDDIREKIYIHYPENGAHNYKETDDFY